MASWMHGGGGKSVEKVQNLVTVAASLATTAVLVRSIINDCLPDEVQDYINSAVSALIKATTSKFMTIVIEDGEGLESNKLYRDVATYLDGMSTPNTRRLRVWRREEEERPTVLVDKGEMVVDVFQGVQLRWLLAYREGGLALVRRRGYDDARRPASASMFELRFHRKHKDMVLQRYLPHVVETSKAIKEAEKVVKLHMLRYDDWADVKLDHPATFDTIAMDAEVKQMLISDLDTFVGRKEYYRRFGKAWKRGYLLYGPPGTGKSSLVAAMANHLKFDVYDLELTAIRDNNELRYILFNTSSRSIIVVEDIDCSINITTREVDDDSSIHNDDVKVTLSGLLNAMDGLWSSCADERIFVFTTNHKERLDPALLRPGRMDLHIPLSYCTVTMFRELMRSYHSVDHHPMFSNIDSLMTDVEVTPAEVVGELMRSDDMEVALGYLERFIVEKKRTAETGEGEVEEAYSEGDDSA